MRINTYGEITLANGEDDCGMIYQYRASFNTDLSVTLRIYMNGIQISESSIPLAAFELDYAKLIKVALEYYVRDKKIESTRGKIP